MEYLLLRPYSRIKRIKRNSRKTLPKIKQLPTPPDSLSDDVKLVVNDIWSSGPASQVAGQFDRYECTRGDLRTLRGKVYKNILLNISIEFIANFKKQIIWNSRNFLEN